MTTKRITEEEISELSVSSLPTRPTAPKAFGGRGYTAAQMKGAFDRLPLLIIERFNELLEDISAFGGGSLADAIPSGFGEGHTLYNLLNELKSGIAAEYIKVHSVTLSEMISSIENRLSAIEGSLGINAEAN